MTAVFIACTAIGLLKSHGLVKHVRQLEAFIGAIDVISTEIRYSASPVSALMAKLAAVPEYRELCVFACCENRLAQVPDFAKAWDASVYESRPQLALDEGDVEALLCFGRVLGTTDIEGQMANCERYKVLLRQRLAAAREERQKRGHMFTSLGVLTGVFLVVLLF